MSDQQVAPYGSWRSPITSDLIVSSTVTLGYVVLDGADVYWAELRPVEKGRTVIVRRTADGRTSDVTPPPFDARTRVHEYGGGAYTVDNGAVYFANFADQRLYRQEPGLPPRPLTPEGGWRYADGVIDRDRRRLICVREDHTLSGQEPANTLIAIDLEAGGPGDVLVGGNDFYASPRLSPDGSRLAWLTWNHPNMPWDGTELWVAEVNADGSLGQSQLVAGSLTESIFQPQWSPDGVLHFISDRSGWWNLYRWRDDQIETLTEREVEFGRPQWVFGMSTYGFASAGRIICCYNSKGRWHLASLDTATRQLRPLTIPYTEITGLQVSPEAIVFSAGSATEPLSIVRFDPDTQQTEILRRSSDLKIDSRYLSIPEAIEYQTEQGLTAHAFYYAPHNEDFVGPPGERPPLLVISHGGPTSATSTTLNPGIQYWTSRGFGVLDVNYGGSTGYGREYRERLKGQWGIVDVDDCVNGALYLVKRGDIDEKRLIIRGGSAGGYTTLSALTFRDTFQVGASYFGVSDLEALARDTHKFESRYLDGLIGPYPERRDLYVERSPIHHTHRLSCALILFQGLEDKVVPPNQAQLMFEAIRAKELPVAYLPFAGEQHGFRQAENIKRSLEAELYFYSQFFGFEPADPVEPAPIENL